MADWLLSVAAGEADAVGVVIEVPRGPVVESLIERGFGVHSINPKQLDRFRDRISPAGAKDDRRDAWVLAGALQSDAHCFRRLEPTDPAIVELREWSRLNEDLTQERVRLANRNAGTALAVLPAVPGRGGRRCRGAVGAGSVAETADATDGPAGSSGDVHPRAEAAPYPPD